MTIIEINEFKDEYKNRYGEDFDVVAATFGQYEMNGTAEVQTIHDQIEDYIVDKNPHYDYDNLATWQKTLIRNAELRQAFYVLHGMDFENYTGINRNSGTVVDKAIISDRIISTRAHKALLSAEVLYQRRGMPED